MNQGGIRYMRQGAIQGFVLGLAAAAGSLVLRCALQGGFGAASFRAELAENAAFYLCLGVLLPAATVLFGAYLGGAADVIAAKHENVEIVLNALRDQSATDGLTGLYNRRHVLFELEKEIERARRHHRPLAVLMVDLDGFKQVNDVHGHLAGDRMLKEMAFALGGGIRKVDIIGRYGGDEFLVILPEARMDTALIVARRLSDAVRKHSFRIGNEVLLLTASVGIACTENAEGLEPNAFIDKADKAMLEAKRRGKDQIVS